MSELTCRNCHHYERTQEGPTAWKHACLAGFEVFSCKESDMSVRIIGALRRIRRCESEAAAQEVLEGLIAELVEKERQAGSMADGWGLRRHVPGEIVVTHKDGSGVAIREDAESIAESMFYRMMDQILLGR